MTSQAKYTKWGEQGFLELLHHEHSCTSEIGVESVDLLITDPEAVMMVVTHKCTVSG